MINKILSHLGLPTCAPPVIRYPLFAIRYPPPAISIDLFQTIGGAKNRLPTQADRESFARLSTAVRPSRPAQQWVFHQAEAGIDISAGRAIWRGHRKGRLKFLFMRAHLHAVHRNEPIFQGFSSGDTHVTGPVDYSLDLNNVPLADRESHINRGMTDEGPIIRYRRSRH